jgi:hypothetical protein
VVVTIQDLRDVSKAHAMIARAGVGDVLERQRRRASPVEGGAPAHQYLPLALSLLGAAKVGEERGNAGGAEMVPQGVRAGRRPAHDN